MDKHSMLFTALGLFATILSWLLFALNMHSHNIKQATRFHGITLIQKMLGERVFLKASGWLVFICSFWFMIGLDLSSKPLTLFFAILMGTLLLLFGWLGGFISAGFRMGKYSN